LRNFREGGRKSKRVTKAGSRGQKAESGGRKEKEDGRKETRGKGWRAERIET
jgi:hypothetical protein